MSEEIITDASLDALLDQRAKLDQLIQDTVKKGKSEALKGITVLVKKYSLTKRDLMPLVEKLPDGAPQNSTVGRKIAPKYQHPETGDTWTGQGKPPKWIAGIEDRTPYLIANT